MRLFWVSQAVPILQQSDTKDIGAQQTEPRTQSKSRLLDTLWFRWFISGVAWEKVNGGGGDVEGEIKEVGDDRATVMVCP